MKKRLNKILTLKMWVFISLLFTGTCHVYAQKIYPSYTDLEHRLEKGADTVFLINFWATWCKPCVEEIPFLNELEHKTIGNRPLHVLLVSLDFTSQINKLVKPFIINNKIRKEVVVLADPDMNTWIPKVDKEWDGAIPISMLVSKGFNSIVYNQAFRNKEELISWISQYPEN